VVLAGCGSSAVTATNPTYIPLTVGSGRAYRPPPAAHGACRPDVGARRGVHVELFAHRHVVLVPAGIGVRGPRFAGAYVRGGRCFGALVTLEPTGVVEVGGGRHTVGDLFAAWGQPVSSTRLAGFSGGRVVAWVDGRPVGGDPATIGLRRHAEIVLEIDGYVPPHRSYDFPPGL
jgi:hypothetical protein